MVRGRALALAALLGSLLLAGCAEPIGPSTTAAQPWRATLVTLEDCFNTGSAYDVPADAARDVLPEGLALADPDAATARLYLVFVSCRDATVERIHQGPVVVAYLELAVAAKAPLAVAGVDDATFPLMLITNSDNLTRAFASWHLGRVGTGTFSPTVVQPLPGFDGIEADLDGSGYSIDASGFVPQDPLPAATFALYGSSNGLADTSVRGEASASASTERVVASKTQHGDVPLLGLGEDRTLGFQVHGFSLRYTLEGYVAAAWSRTCRSEPSWPRPRPRSSRRPLPLPSSSAARRCS